MRSISVLTLAITAILSIEAHAQKLPTEQKISLRTPANTKVDGKAAELNNTFQAYNNHTDFYYTLSNNDEKLYLTVQATDPAIIRHIVSGGITLTINRSGQKNDKNAPTITYPVFEKNNRFTPVFKSVNSTSTSADGGMVIRTRVSAGAVLSKEPLTDSAVNVTNKNFNQKAKMIRVTGMKNIDTLISVYNTDGIKAAATFDNKMAYTYELSIDLKNIDLSVKNDAKFTYQLKINEVESQGVNIVKDDAGKILSISISGPNVVMAQSATDFWGEYVLAK